jgi:protein HOOK3
VAAIEREEIEALEDLKAVNKIITSSLQNDLLTLQSKHRNLATHFELQQKQLYEAVISKDRVIKEKEDLKEAKGSNEENAQAIVEAENAQKSLKEVSQPQTAKSLWEAGPKSFNSPQSPRKSIFGMLFGTSRLSNSHTTTGFHNFPAFLNPFSPEEQAEQTKLQAVLALERQAGGSLPRR